MEMTKLRKMLIGVLCLGLGGLAVDRFVLGSPQSASADDGEVTIEVAPEIEPVTVAPSPPQEDAQQAKALPSYASLTERLVKAQQQQIIDPQAETREDPFALPPQWQADRPTPQAQVQPEPGSKAHRITTLFKLDGTVRTSIDGKDEMLAVISGGGLDGRAIREGQKVRVPSDNGSEAVYTLIKVGPRFVIWQPEGSQEEITMRVAEVLSGG